MDVREAIYHYCNYQERCHSQVRDKLFSLGCPYKDVDGYIAELIEKDLLNEQRFTCSFVRTRFGQKHWGRKKIVFQLKQLNISDYCIRKGLAEIDDEEYLRTAAKLMEKKWNELRTEKNVYKRKQKVFQYLHQKGFETDVITEMLKEIMTGY